MAGGSQGISQTLPSAAQRGKALHLALLARHKGLDRTYRTPNIEGAMTPDPVCVIHLTVDDWSGLAPAQKRDLADYISSMVAVMKTDPMKYTGIPASAPMAPRIRENVERMTATSWEIVTGAIISGGRDICSDRTVLSGH
jgi:hypothetical protein